MQAPTQHNAAILKTHRKKAQPLSGHFLWPGNGAREAGWEKSENKKAQSPIGDRDCNGKQFKELP